MAYGSCHDIDLIQATAMTYDAAAAALDPLIHCTRPRIEPAPCKRPELLQSNS